MIDRLLFAAAILHRWTTRTAYDHRWPVWVVELLTLAFAILAALTVTGALAYLIR